MSTAEERDGVGVVRGAGGVVRGAGEVDATAIDALDDGLRGGVCNGSSSAGIAARVRGVEKRRRCGQSRGSGIRCYWISPTLDLLEHDLLLRSPDSIPADGGAELLELARALQPTDIVVAGRSRLWPSPAPHAPMKHPPST
jgi:hypothetical protein